MSDTCFVSFVFVLFVSPFLLAHLYRLRMSHVLSICTELSSLFVKAVWSKCAIAKLKHMFGATGRPALLWSDSSEWGKNNYCLTCFEAKSVDSTSFVVTLKRGSPCSSDENAAGRRWTYSFPRQAGSSLPSRKVHDR